MIIIDPTPNGLVIHLRDMPEVETVEFLGVGAQGEARTVFPQE